MKNKLLLAMIALALLVPVVSAASPTSDGADYAVTNYYVEGYVAEGGGTGKIPMEGVTVAITDRQGLVSQATTDSNGFFSIGINTNTNLTISFKVFGYTIIACPNTSVQQETGNLILNLPTAQYNTATRVYTITSSVNEMQCAIMATSDGIVKGVVSSDGGYVKNAVVSLARTDKEGSYKTHTDDHGYYEITCPTGVYTLSVSGQGFNQSDGITVNVASNPSTISVPMERSELKKHFGLDTAHILMLIGVIVGILLAAAAWFLSKRMNGPHHIEIFDDGAGEDDGIRYP